MSDWDELGQLYAIHKHAHSIKRKQMTEREANALADKLGSAGARFDAPVALHPEPLAIVCGEAPALKFRYSSKTIWEEVAAA